MNPPPLGRELAAVARQAGEEILRVYRTDFSIERKDDASPLTEADRAADTLIRNFLERLDAGIPILSEESQAADWTKRQTWDRLFIVDPLDGTREFVKRNGEFTVNIALVEEGRPILGVVFQPVGSRMYLGVPGLGAWTAGLDGIFHPVSPAVVQTSGIPLRVVTSRSHLNERTASFLASLQQRYGKLETIQAGSSLKFCRVALGEADLYPRLGPTMEWDTAAAQAFVEACGGSVLHMETGASLRYNKQNLRNPEFIVLRPGFSSAASGIMGKEQA